MKLAIRKTSAALAAVATAGVSSLFLGAAPASAATIDGCGEGILLSPGECELTFTSGTGTFTAPATSTQLEVLLVGAGGSGSDVSGVTVPSSTGYSAAGGGGEVKIVDLSGTTTEISALVATPAVPGQVSDGVNPAVTVANGFDGSGGQGGASGSGFPGGSATTSFPAAGGGGSSAASNAADGGEGTIVSTIALPGSLFADDANCYGGGGAAGNLGTQGTPGCGGGGPTDMLGTTLAPAVANSGGGGGGLNITQDATARAGADGLAVIRWNGATVTLSFDPSGHGETPVSQTVVAGTAGVQPATPTADGFEFKGWFADAALTIPADFSVALTASTTYYASWVAVLPETGSTPATAALPIGIAALLAGAGLFAVASRRRRETN